MTVAEQAAAKLMEFLEENVGTTADWPVEIACDDKEIADRLSFLMTDLTNKLRLAGWKPRLQKHPL